MRPMILWILFSNISFQISYASEYLTKDLGVCETQKCDSSDCCICFEELKGSLYSCQVCNKSIHKKCVREWLRTKYEALSLNTILKREGSLVDCPLCRGSQEVDTCLYELFSYELLDLAQEIKTRYFRKSPEILMENLTYYYDDLCSENKRSLLANLLTRFTPLIRRDVLNGLYPFISVKLKSMKKTNNSKKGVVAKGEKACCIIS